jgi:hypothetical protein
MNHSWKFDLEYKDRTRTFQKKKVCVTCGCEKFISTKHGHTIEVVERSGILFDRLPDCIDWEVENAKTID